MPEFIHITDITEQLLSDWSQYNVNFDLTFKHWKENIYKGGYYLYLIQVDSINNGEHIKKGHYWVELNNSLEKVRGDGPFQSYIDAASDLGKADYQIYKSLNFGKFPTVSPFESDQNLHRAWSNGFEFQMALDKNLSDIKYPKTSGFYWFILNSKKTICYLNRENEPPSISALCDLTNEDLKIGKWIGPISEPRLQK